MKLVTQILGIATAVVLTTSPAMANGSSFKQVWDTVQLGPYAELPQYQTTYDSLFDDNISLIALSANRTLDNDADTLPWFQKLVHPVGICFAGTWTITEENPYTGYFAKGAEGLIIVRASEALGSVAVGDWRAFGLAGKIFPTTNTSSQTASDTANFFTVDDLGGTNADSFLDLSKSNAPKTSFHLSQLAIFPMLTEIARTFKHADQDPGVRQVYQIGELGLASGATALSPERFSLVSENDERINADDFRSELRIANYPQGLNFGIYTSNGDDNWVRLGQIHLDKEALSDGCDHRLHFNHPRWK